MEKLLTLSQTAEKLQLTEETLRRLIKKGDFPGFKIGGSWRVDQKDLESYIEEKKTV